MDYTYGASVEDLEAEEEKMFLLTDTATENGSAFCDVFENHDSDVWRFLKRDTYIPVRSTSVGTMEQSDLIFYEHDVDGVVIEWRTLEGIDFVVPFIQFIPRGKMSLQSVYGVLKKHFDLKKFSNEALNVFRRSLGSQVSYSGGWETWVAFIPDFELDNALQSVDFTSMSVKAFTNLRLIFQNYMKEQIGKCSIDSTLAKNNLNNLSYTRILPDHQYKVMTLLQKSLDSLDVCVPGIKKIAFSFRFGEKCKNDMNLPIRSPNSVVNVTTHIGLTLYGKYTTDDEYDESINIDLFWSRIGLQEIVGDRGVLTSAYSFKECANYQSNLDGKEMHIAGDLRSVCLYPNQLRFVQLYADIPHRRPKTRVHPVSGAVALLDGIIKKRDSVDADAVTYISEVENNFKQVTRSCCRLEMVISMPDDCVIIQPASLLQIEKVSELFKRYSLVVPFLHPGFIKILQSVGLVIVNDMKRLLNTCRGSGKSEAVWQAYQSELAIEKLLWGHPLCIRSRLFSVNLGPGLENPSRSQTDMLGFLSLCESTACCSDEDSSPPVCIYSRNEITQKQMKKTFGLMDLVEGGSIMSMGRRLVFILLQDLHETGGVACSFEMFFLSLKVGGAIGSQRIVGGTSQKQMAELVGSAGKAKYPMVTVHMIKLLKKNGVDVLAVLEMGFRHLELLRFPAVRLHDEQRHAGVCWKWNYGLLVFTDIPEANENSEIKASLLTPLVVTEMENRKLCHARILRNVTFPWIRPCIDKLSELKLTDKNLVIVLTFVSCLARLMDGAYVDYYKLSQLRCDLPSPVTQRRLQTLQIQSKFLMNSFNLFRLWRLHHSIPFRVLTAEKSKASNETVEKENKQKEVVEPVFEGPERIPPFSEENASDVGRVFLAPVQHRPSNALGRWTSAELGLLADIKEKNNELAFKSQYELYKNACQTLGIPDRSMVSVRRKLSRI